MIQAVDSAVQESKKFLLLLFFFNLIFSFAMQNLLAKIGFLEAMIFHLAINFKFTGIILGFFEPILGYLNFDLLDEFEFFQEPIEPSEEFTTEFSPNFGFIGFDTSSFVLNLGSACLIIPAYFLYFILVALAHGTLFLDCAPEALRAVIRKKYEALYWTGILEFIDSVQSLLILSASIMIRKQSTQKFIAIDLDLILMLVSISLVIAAHCMVAWKMY